MNENFAVTEIGNKKENIKRGQQLTMFERELQKLGDIYINPIQSGKTTAGMQ